MEIQKFDIVSSQSNIDWVARKVTGFHNGVISIKEGKITVNDGKLTGAKFIIDTTSINVLNVADPASNAKLVAHLASDDFFSSQKYPEATFEITAVLGDYIEGSLTIKNITRPIFFKAYINLNGNVFTATAKLVIDRTKYNMRFRSGNFFTGLGDSLIYDDFEVNVSVTARAAKDAVLV